MREYLKPVNAIPIAGIIFVAGTLVATWALHLRDAEAHMSIADRNQWQRIENKLTSLEQQLDEELADLRRKDCLLAYAIDFPDSNCESVFQWLDDHPRVRERIRGQYENQEDDSDEKD